MLAIQEETNKTTSYPVYKPSHIDWIGNIPQHWEIIKLGHYTYIVRGASPRPAGDPNLFEGDFIHWITVKEITNGSGKYVTSTDTFLTEEGMKQSRIVEPETLVISNSGATLGVPKILKIKGCINDGSVAFTSIKEKLYRDYTYYFLFSQTELLREQQSGYGQPNLNTDIIANIKLPLPPISEQQAIAIYLDQKTALIDELIAKKQRKIDLLKEQRTAIINHAVTKGLNPNVDLKDSGVEWIGEIPEHWGRKRIKQLSKIISKGTTPSTVSRELLEEGEIRYLKAENISDNKVVPFPSFFIDNETDSILSRSKLLENDILFVIAGATLGKVAILPKEFIPANTNQAVSFIRLKEGYNVNFAWYWLSSSILQEQIWIDAVQSAQPNLSMENLGNFHIPFPPLSEQQSIVAYLDEQTAFLNNAISLEAQKIEKLKEYRQSLISAAVTGKICVLPVTENELSKAR